MAAPYPLSGSGVLNLVPVAAHHLGRLLLQVV